jgi:DNA-binding transcriptional regulator YiaG
MEIKGACILGKHIRRTYIRKFGTIPDSVNVCHHCDNPDCKNWDHVFLGTQSDNIQDSIAKGRFITEKRRKHSDRSKLAMSLAKRKITNEQVEEIRNTPNKSSYEWAKELGVSHFTIRNIKSRGRKSYGDS